MLANEGLHAVIVATSTDAHRDATLAALQAGCDVLVEKPIARRYSEAVEMADAAREAKRKLMVGMNHRFRPDTMLLKSFIEGKELGKVFYTKCGWLRKRSSDSAWVTQKEKSGGGVFVDLGIPMLDLAFWLMGYPEVRRVSAVELSPQNEVGGGHVPRQHHDEERLAHQYRSELVDDDGRRRVLLLCVRSRRDGESQPAPGQQGTPRQPRESCSRRKWNRRSSCSAGRTRTS